MQNKLITHINFAKGFRGGERQTLLLIKELSSKGYTQKIITRVGSLLAKRLQNIDNLEIVQIAKPYILHINILKGSNIVHAHETKGAQFAFFGNIFYDIPYIVTRRVDNPIKNNIFNKYIYKNASYSVALSKAIEDGILKLDDTIETKIIPSAFSVLKTNSKNISNLKKRFEGKFVVGNIGELDNKHKGQYYLIEAAKVLQQKYPDIHIIFLGKGCDEQNYKNQAKDLSNITFEGFVDNVADYINIFDLFVFPSLHEGLGSILFDIMQYKVPIIATKVGGIPDIIKNNQNGILIEPNSSDDIVKYVEKLYLDKTFRDSLSLEAYKNVDTYSPQSMASRYIELYDLM